MKPLASNCRQIKDDKLEQEKKQKNIWQNSSVKNRKQQSLITGSTEELVSTFN